MPKKKSRNRRSWFRTARAGFKRFQRMVAGNLMLVLALLTIVIFAGAGTAVTRLNEQTSESGGSNNGTEYPGLKTGCERADVIQGSCIDEIDQQGADETDSDAGQENQEATESGQENRGSAPTNQPRQQPKNTQQDTKPKPKKKNPSSQQPEQPPEQEPDSPCILGFLFC
jgi:outer membrane biosynthesis protein TonB